MPNYRADPDIAEIMARGLALPDYLDAAEAERVSAFARCDQALEEHYRTGGGSRPPETVLRAVAQTAMAAYDQRSDRLPVGWQKLLVLQAGIASCQDNLDDFEIQEWAYTRIKDHHPEWLGDFDDDLDQEKPLRWLTQLIGFQVLAARNRAAGG